MTKKYWLALCAASGLLAGCGQRDDKADTADASADAPHPVASASVLLAPTQGNISTGSLALSPQGDSVRLSGSMQSLDPNGEFGFHIHEKGDCSAPDASSAGAHFNPANSQHGNPQVDPHHAGDMSNARSDVQGTAVVDVMLSGVSLDSGQPNNVRGKAVVLHEKADDYSTQPAGNSGARIACGVIK